MNTSENAEQEDGRGGGGVIFVLDFFSFYL